MKTILVVDDERCVRQLYRDAFEDEGWRVVEAAGAEAALRLLRSGPVDLAVLDIQMPHTHGLELLGRVHAGWRELPVILCSGLPKLFNDFAVWDAREQVAGMFPKPVELSALVECAARALDAPAAPALAAAPPRTAAARL